MEELLLELLSEELGIELVVQQEMSIFDRWFWWGGQTGID